ncbi:CTR2 protein, partial [Acromyrmex insinuator]
MVTQGRDLSVSRLTFIMTVFVNMFGHTCLYFIDKIEFCTFITYGTGLCNGDSGSGLIRNSDNTIVGLVPDGISCAECYPDIYTNVYSYVS